MSQTVPLGSALRVDVYFVIETKRFKVILETDDPVFKWFAPKRWITKGM